MDKGFRGIRARSGARLDIQQAFDKAMSLHRQARLTDGEQVYEDILRHDPRHFDALHLLGVISLQTDRAKRAVEQISRAISILSNEKIAVRKEFGSDVDGRVLLMQSM